MRLHIQNWYETSTIPLNLNHLDIPVFRKPGEEPAAFMIIGPNPPGSGPINHVRVYKRKPKNYPFWEGAEVTAEIGSDGKLRDPVMWDHGDPDNEITLDDLKSMRIQPKAVASSVSQVVEELTLKIRERNRELKQSAGSP